MYCMQIQNTPLEINETVKKISICLQKLVLTNLLVLIGHALANEMDTCYIMFMYFSDEKCQWTVLHPLSLFTEQASGGTEHIISPNQGFQIRTASHKPCLWEVVWIRNAWLGKLRTHQYCDILSLRMRNLVASQHSSYESASHEFETNWGAKVLKRFNPCVYKTLKYILQMLAL